MIYKGLVIGLLSSAFFVMINGGVDSKTISEDDSRLHTTLSGYIREQNSFYLEPSPFPYLAQQTVNIPDITFFDYIPDSKEYVWANYKEIVAQGLDADKRQLFACNPRDLIKSVQYRPIHNDLIVATTRELMLCAIAQAIKYKVLYSIPDGERIRSVRQLADNRLLMMTTGQIRYWDFKSDEQSILAEGDRNYKLVSGDVKRDELFFTEGTRFIAYDLATRFCKRTDLKKTIQSALYKNGAVYVMTEHSVLHYDIASNICKSLITLPKKLLLRSFTCNNDETKFLMRTDDQIILYDSVAHRKQTLFRTSNDHIWSISFYDKNENQYIVRTSDGVQMHNLLTEDIQVLFKKNQKENALFAVYHNKQRDELLITTAHRVIIVSLANQTSQELVVDHYIKSARYNDAGTCLEVGTIDGTYTMYDLDALDLSKQIRSIDAQDADISVAPEQIIDDYEKLFEEHATEKNDGLFIDSYPVLITGCVAFASLFISSIASIY